MGSGKDHLVRGMNRQDRTSEAFTLPPFSSRFRSAYNEPLTPSSNTSLSPVGSPVSEIAFEKPNLPSAADWSEFLSASTSEKVENEFAQLTLSDHEQRELYEAARLVQTAFRKYKVERPRPGARSEGRGGCVIQTRLGLCPCSSQS